MSLNIRRSAGASPASSSATNDATSGGFSVAVLVLVVPLLVDVVVVAGDDVSSPAGAHPATASSRPARSRGVIRAGYRHIHDDTDPSNRSILNGRVPATT